MSQSDPDAGKIDSSSDQAKAQSVFKTVWMAFALGHSCGLCCGVEDTVELAAVDATGFLAREHVSTWVIATFGQP